MKFIMGGASLPSSSVGSAFEDDLDLSSEKET